MEGTNASKSEKCKDIDKWGYVVGFGTIITFVAGIGHVNSFGLIYKDFIVDTHSSAKSLTTAHGVFAVMLAIGGLILSTISKRLSLRLGGLIGASLMSIGSFSTIFISNTSQLPLTFGLFQGVGFGMMVPVCYSTLNHYFKKKRTLAMSLIKAVQGFILIWYPQLVKVMLSFYGFRASLLIISAISLHTLPGMLAMKTSFETKKKPANGKLASDINKQETIDLLSDNNKNNGTQEAISSTRRRNTLRNEILELLNLKILKDPVFCNICIGQSFVNFSDLIFFILHPMLLFQYGYNTNQVTTCISVSAGADVAGRFVLALITSFFTINTRLLFYVATFLTLVARIAILQVRQFTYVVLVTSMLGVLRAWLHVSSPVVISNHVTHQDFTGAYALFMLAAGIVNVIFSPIIGLIKDVNQDYVPAFYALTLCCLPCLLFWPIEYKIIKRRNAVTTSDQNQTV